VYILRGHDGQVVMMAGLWVDDVIAAAATATIKDDFIKGLRSSFKVDDRGDLQWVLGMKVDYERARRRVTLSAAARIEALCELHGVEKRAMRKYATPADIGILDLEDNETMNKEGYERTQKLIGALIYISTTCRPDIAHAVYRCATYMSKPNQKVWSAALRVLGYLQNTKELGVTYDGASLSGGLSAQHAPFGPAGSSERAGTHLHSLSDANWEVNRSISGYLIMLGGAAVVWSCKKQPATALSSTDAETYAASAAAAELVWARELLTELGEPQAEPTTLWVDNTGAVATAQDAQSIGRSRHIARRAHFLLRAHEVGALRVLWLKTGSTAADALTKPLPAKQFTRLRGYIMNAAEHA